MRALLARRGGLAWNSALNALGQGIPVLVALVAVPGLVRGLGPERFGVLTLAWAVIGYFGLFDFGLGRALTQLVASRRASHDAAALGPLVRAALRLLLALGVAGALVAAALAPWLGGAGLDVTPALRGEVRASFVILALAIPAVVLTSGLRGLLEAYERFGVVNAIRVPLGVWNYLVPLLLLGVTRNVAAVVATLVVGRIAAMVVHLHACRRVLPELGEGRGARVPLKPLFQQGGWMTVSNLVSPLMMTADRFLIGALASAAVVAYYTVPYEMVTKLMIVAGAVGTSLLPAVAAGEGSGARVPALYTRGLLLTAAALFPLTLLVTAFAPELLRIWAGPAYGLRGATALRILAIGVYVNCLAQVAFAVVQGSGRADLAARLHLVEVPLYLALAWWLVRHWGIDGAAIAWTVRSVVDGAAMFAMARHVAPGAARQGHGAPRAVVALSVAAVALLALASHGATIAGRAAIVGVACLAALAAAARMLAPSGARRLA